MRRAFLGCFIAFLFVAAVVIGIGAIAYVFSDGQALGSLQLFVLRLQLSEREDELYAAFRADDHKIRFHIPSGTSAGAIAADLQSAGLIGGPQLFLDFARVQGLDRRFEAGTYFLAPSQSIAEIAVILTDSSASFIPFRILEGSRIEEVAELIDGNAYFAFSGAEFLQLVSEDAPLRAEFAQWAGIPSGASLEGFLFPDTYQLPPDVSPTGLRDILLTTFLERVGEQLQRDALAQGLTLYQFVTLASIVEREAVWPDEHAMIASVYRNRLAIGMRLEADPTVQYGLQGQRDRWWPNITRADYVQVDSAYNTYLHGGFPPGPIASPGLSAIEAAIHPADSAFLYFRAACDNSHYHNFAITFAEHLQNGC